MYTPYKYKELTLTATNYNTKVSVELPADAELSEVFDAFKTLISGLGYMEGALETIILDHAEIYENRILREEKETNRLHEIISDLRAEINTLKGEKLV